MKPIRTLIGIALLFVPLAAWAQNNNDVLRHLEEKYGDLKAAYADASAQYGPASPQVLRLKEQMAQIQDQIEARRRDEMMAAQSQAQAQADLAQALHKPQELQRNPVAGGGPGNFTYMTTGGPGPGMGMGAWWKNSEIVSKLQLSDEQVKKISQTFLDHKLKLIDLQADLEKHELRLQPLMDVDQPDDSKVGEQIDLITAARGRLEKENAMMMLAIRRWLSVEQWKKLKTIEASDEMRPNFLYFRGGPGVNMPGPPAPPLPGDMPVWKGVPMPPR